jgi:hypothetical protein
MNMIYQILTSLSDYGYAIFILVALFAFAFYFLPSIVALVKRKRNALAIFFLNLFAGWTGVGWLIALIWAAIYENIDSQSNKKSEKEQSH